MATGSHSPSTVRHAHFDCSRGATGVSLLTAGLHAINNLFLGLLESHIEELTSILPVVFGALGISHGLLNITIDETRQRQVPPISVEVLTDSHGNNGEVRLLEQLNRVIKDVENQKQLPLWLKASFKAAISEYFKAELDHSMSSNHAVSLDVKWIAVVVEIFATIWCLDKLQVRSFSYSPLKLQAIDFYSEPARMTSILQEMAVVTTASSECGTSSLVSATAAAILKVLSQPTEKRPQTMTVRSVVQGTDQNHQKLVTSLTIGEILSVATLTINDNTSSDLWTTDIMIVLETNLDDQTPEHIAFCIELLLQAGAADAWTTPIVMKKGRSAVTLSCLCRLEQQSEMLTELFCHSTTLGVRIQSIQRASLRRQYIHVQTEWTNVSNAGLIGVKVGFLGYRMVSIKAEYDHCRTVATEARVPIQVVSSQAVAKALECMEAKEPSAI